MHDLRIDRNDADFDKFDYDIAGRDRHVDEFVREAEALHILRRDFTGVITRDLRVVKHHAWLLSNFILSNFFLAFPTSRFFQLLDFLTWKSGPCAQTS